MFTEKSIYLEKFHVFGTECYVYVPKEKRKKWDKKGKHGIFVGYSDHMDGFRVWHKSENCIVRSKDDVFGQEITEKLLFPGETSDNARAEEQKSVPDLVQSSSESSS